MKTKSLPSPLVVGALCGLLAVSALAADNREKSNAPSSPPTGNASTKAAPAENKKEPPSTSLEEEKAAAEANRRHILPAPDLFLIAVPPPPPRAEAKLPTPTGIVVWKPGHWAAVKGEWQWTSGEWGVPPVPSSVWIEGKYDAKAQRWSPGYWQPDRVPAPEEKSPAKDSTPVEKRY